MNNQFHAIERLRMLNCVMTRTGWTAARVICAMATLLLIVGCTDADRGKLRGIGSHFKVSLFSGGQAVGQWESSGKVRPESHSDGYYFVDRKTGHLIEISGTIIIERLD